MILATIMVTRDEAKQAMYKTVRNTAQLDNGINHATWDTAVAIFLVRLGIKWTVPENPRRRSIPNQSATKPWQCSVRY